MSYHKNKEVNHALIKLFDALCEYERNCGCRSTVILVPHEPGERFVVAQDGKPIFLSPQTALDLAITERNRQVLERLDKRNVWNPQGGEDIESEN